MQRKKPALKEILPEAIETALRLHPIEYVTIRQVAIDYAEDPGKSTWIYLLLDSGKDCRVLAYSGDDIALEASIHKTLLNIGYPKYKTKKVSVTIVPKRGPLAPDLSRLQIVRSNPNLAVKVVGWLRSIRSALRRVHGPLGNRP